ncbi:SsrA-binding protein [Patescibacteria group bacterium]|nr:SsrA-binding protein [Patescibacteria group bacterium]
MRHFNKESLDYQFIDKFEAGIALTGSDVKSLRLQPPHFASAKVDFLGGRPYLVNLDIPAYQYSQNQTQDTTHSRALLLTEKEIAKLISWRHQKYMIIPIAIFFKDKWAKVELGVGRKMKKYEKRAKIKQREFERGV